MTTGYAGDETVQVVFEDMGFLFEDSDYRYYRADVNGMDTVWSVPLGSPDSEILNHGLHQHKHDLMARHAREVNGMVDEGEV